MIKKKTVAIAGGLTVVLVVALLMLSTANLTGFDSLLGYSGSSVSGEGAIAYMQISGNSQGVLEGDVTESGKEDLHAIFAIDHEIEIPRDSMTGLPTGQRIHKPLSVTTHLSPSVPKIYQMCTFGEQGSVEIHYWRTDDRGQDEHYFTIKLDDAIIMNMSHYKPMTILPENETYGDMITLSFSYSAISWIDELTGIETRDDWKMPR